MRPAPRQCRKAADGEAKGCAWRWRKPGGRSGAGGSAHDRGRFGMTPAENLVLAVAALLAVVVFVEGRNGAIAVPVGVFLLTLAMLAAVAALLHMAVR